MELSDLKATFCGELTEEENRQVQGHQLNIVPEKHGHVYWSGCTMYNIHYTMYMAPSI